MEPFPDVLVVSNNLGQLQAVCRACVAEEEKIEGNLVAEVRNDMILEYRGFAIALHEYKCPRCGSTHKRTT